ncbi:MAG TPA: NAD(P)H-dependent oxidoreductase subunit E [Syntrophorhabdaceae bacterium]|nr:NAD(P)H-dependent oxidoreductase subunit E [Syntrophorhabdaceae bacterium]HNT68049.1 NAD(P)H-dependent oxidoreductase subunit E [Syntrophorhabdaceae bacterium]
MYREQTLKKFNPALDNILYILHDLQDNNPEHYLAKEDIRACADYLEVPYSYVHSVASFYTMFSLKPRGRYIIRLCDSPPCHLMGSQSLLDYLKKSLDVKVGETTKDKMFTLELTSCLGACGVAPAMMINEEMFGNLTPAAVDAILEKRRKEL